MRNYTSTSFVRRPQNPLTSSSILLGSSLGQLFASKLAPGKSLATLVNKLSACDSNDAVKVCRLLRHCPLKLLPLAYTAHFFHTNSARSLHCFSRIATTALHSFFLLTFPLQTVDFVFAQCEGGKCCSNILPLCKAQKAENIDKIT